MRADQQARKEKPRYDGRCRHGKGPGAASGRPPVVRFKNPEEGATVVEDVVHGAVTFQNKELDDLIIARSDGTPTYNFCVVVDDADMGVTHVIRGDDHLNNTPRQMNMLLALGQAPPVYAHVPMILGPDGAKLSKRHGAVSVLRVPGPGLSTRGAAELSGAPRLVAWRPGVLHARRDDRGLRRARHQQVGLGAQSGKDAVAEPAAPGARAAGTSCRTCAGTWRARHRSQDQTLARGHHRRAARTRQDAQGDGGEQPLLLRRASHARSARRRRNISRRRRAGLLRKLRARFAALPTGRRAAALRRCERSRQEKSLGSARSRSRCAWR